MKKIIRKLLTAGAISAVFLVNCNVFASESNVMSSVQEEAQVLPVPDGSGKYIMKSDGFYCLNADGTREKNEEVHYFNHFEINGTVWDGLYYHDSGGKFRAGDSRLVHIKNLSVNLETEEEPVVLDGFYFVNNLGKLTAASQVRYLDKYVADNVTFDGYYYFDDTGKLITNPGIHQVDMICRDRYFNGNYYFGGTDGALTLEALTTEEGYEVDANGKVTNLEHLGIENLRPQLEKMMKQYDGEWSVYVKDLNADNSVLINDKSLYSASLIKAFVMAKTYRDMEEVQANEAKKMNTTNMEAAVAKVQNLLWNMITVSDNESFNELVRLQTESLDFKSGAQAVNLFLEEEGYTETLAQHTLHPSSSKEDGLGGRNMTSVKDCGLLLERIFKGECVSEEASEAMLELLLNQEVTWKIPEGLPEGIISGNKTGETTEDQHDIAIIYGEKTDYILCVMSENCPSEDDAIDHVRAISKVVYTYLNA